MPRPDVLDKLLRLHACLEAGIAPLWDSEHSPYALASAQKALATLDPADARKVKRKFRKLWRKLAMAEVQRRMANCPPETRAEAVENDMKRTYGALGGKPSAHQLSRRKTLVAKHLLKTVVIPKREASDHPDKDDGWCAPP